MELDTGATRSLIAKENFDKIFLNSINKPQIMPSLIKLKKYGNVEIKLIGETIVNVKLNNNFQKLTLLVVDESGPALFGRDWIHAFHLPILNSNVNSHILNNTDNSIVSSQDIDKLLNEFLNIFQPGLGTFKNVAADLYIDPNVAPRYLKARPVPYALKDKIDEELDFLVKEKIIEPVKYSKWACPIVQIVKPCGKICICGDYKITANKAIYCEKYPLPKPKELLSTLAGGQYFAKLDLRHSYN